MSQERDENNERGYKIHDHRRFESDGTIKDEADEGDRVTEKDFNGLLPDIDFSTFILSLVTSAMIHLGETSHPDGVTRKELSLAKQTIDMIAMLKEKTRGNLTAEEEKLVEEVLYDLRLRYCRSC
jgi:hypothetical protein